MTGQIRIEGVVRLDGRPVGPDEVLVISKEMDELLGAGSTDSVGRFAVPVDAGHRTEALVVAKLRGTTVALQSQTVPLPASASVAFDFDTKRLKWLRGEVETNGSFPDVLDVFVDPVRLQGVPEALQPFFRQKERGVRDAYFAKVQVRGRSFDFRLQPGTYRVGGQFVNYDQPLALNPVLNYVVSAATLAPANTKLPGDESMGFLVEVDQDRKIVLWLRTLTQAELVGQPQSP